MLVCAISRPRKRTRDLDAVAVVQEFLSGLDLGVEVVGIDARRLMRISLISTTRWFFLASFSRFF